MTDSSCYISLHKFSFKNVNFLDELIATKIIRFQIDVKVTLLLQFCKLWVTGSDSYYEHP